MIKSISIHFSGIAWLVSVIAVVISAALAWMQGSFFRRSFDEAQGRAGVDMGFVNHGGMWGDLVLLPIANAAIVPQLQPGLWILAALALSSALSVWVHIHWYRGDAPGWHSNEHMWPSRRHGSWWRDLSWAGWAHVVYVAGELTILIGFLLFPMNDLVIAVVAIIFTLHLPLGLLQPRWFLTGEIAGPRKQPLLLPLLGTLWIVGLLKI